MSIYSNLINLFNRTPKEKTPIKEPEEKTIDFRSILPGVSDGRLYYMYIEGMNKSFSTNYAINKCVNILAYNLSRLPLRFSKDGEMLPIGTKVNGFDISQPHPRMSLSKLLYEAGVYYWYKGEFMSLLDEEYPFSLEPINPDQMVIGQADGRNIISWKYGKEFIPEERLIYVPMMNPDANIGATGKITDKGRTLPLIGVVEKELSNYANGRDFNSQFFFNYAQLGLTLKDINAMTSREDRQAIADQIDNKISKDNAWRTRVLPQGLDIADTNNLSMREMEFSQSMKDIRDIILGVYGVPRSVFGITNEAGLAQNTVDVENRIMWTGTVQPAAYMIQEAFNQTLAKRYFPGYKLVFDYSVIDVLQDNMIEKTELAIKMQGLGYTTEEINDKLDMGMEESTDTRMNERFYPTTLVGYSEVEFSMDDTVDEPAKEIDSNKIVLDKETKGINPQQYRSKFNRIQRKIEKPMAGKLGYYFVKQLGKVLGLVKEQKTVKDVNEVLLLSEIMNLLQEDKKVLAVTMEPIYTDGALKGSNLALNTLKLDKPAMASEEIVKALSNEITTINNHTYRLIRTQVKDAINAGETIPQMSKRIQKVYKFNTARAKLIARTESLKVLSRSTDAEYKKEGVKKKEWLSSADSRDSHALCSAQGAILYDDPFSNGLMFPGDAGPASEVCNCTCALAPVIE